MVNYGIMDGKYKCAPDKDDPFCEFLYSRRKSMGPMEEIPNVT